VAEARGGEVLWAAPGHVVARWLQVFIQVRAGEMTLGALAQIEMAGRLARAQMQGKMGVIFVVAAGAPPPTLQTARRQRELISSLEADPRLYVAAVFEGDNLGAMAQRAVIRTIFRSTYRRSLHKDVAAAVEWLGRVIEPPFDAVALLSYVRTLRAGM
jgi:hypothetical protein